MKKKGTNKMPYKLIDTSLFIVISLTNVYPKYISHKFRGVRNIKTKEGKNKMGLNIA